MARPKPKVPERVAARARRALVALALATVSGTAPALADSWNPDPLPVDAEVSEAPPAIRLLWTEAEPRFAGNVEISRRTLGETGPETWQVVAPRAGPVLAWTDGDVTPGIAYEYRVRRIGRDVVDAGYYTAGIALPAIDRRGTAVIVADRTLSAELAPDIDRLADDLAGDGWHVRRLEAPRGGDKDPWLDLSDARELKVRLAQLHAAKGPGDFAILLVGHLPLVKSGRAAPDGHQPMAIGTDLFYADLNGDWPIRPDGSMVPDVIPDDRIEAQVGRIDFSTVSQGATETELELLRDYLGRNHAWRHGEWGDLRQAYGTDPEHLRVELHGLDNIVGPDQVTEGGHHDAGELHRWLFGVDFGDASGLRYLTDHAAKPVFAINFGSHKMRIERRFNQMTGMMSAPNQALAVGWGARPAWRLHAMALGRTMGEAQFRTVNNGRASTQDPADTEYRPTGRYPFTNSIWLNLLGDPTLHAFPVNPPSGLEALQADDGVRLTWTAPPDGALGYRLYRAADGGDFTPIGPELIEAQAFTDPEGRPGQRYMLRAMALKRVHAGSFRALSQGIFTRCCKG